MLILFGPALIGAAIGILSGVFFNPLGFLSFKEGFRRVLMSMVAWAVAFEILALIYMGVKSLF